MGKVTAPRARVGALGAATVHGTFMGWVQFIGRRRSLSTPIEALFGSCLVSYVSIFRFGMEGGMCPIELTFRVSVTKLKVEIHRNIVLHVV